MINPIYAQIFFFHFGGNNDSATLRILQGFKVNASKWHCGLDLWSIILILFEMTDDSWRRVLSYETEDDAEIEDNTGTQEHADSVERLKPSPWKNKSGVDLWAHYLGPRSRDPVGCLF